MAATVTRATPSGLRAEGGEANIATALQAFTERATALQAFTEIRLANSPKEYKQLFSTATVATELPRGSAQQVMKVALGAQ
eukprot:6008748-Amphidinium_carterae.1